MSGPDDITQPWGSGPDVYLVHTRDVLARARARHAADAKLIARCELLEVGLVSWRTGYVRPDDRARDINEVFEIRDAATKAGLLP